MWRRETLLEQIRIYTQLVQQQETLIATYIKLNASNHSTSLDDRICRLEQQMSSSIMTLERYKKQLEELENPGTG